MTFDLHENPEGSSTHQALSIYTKFEVWTTFTPWETVFSHFDLRWPQLTEGYLHRTFEVHPPLTSLRYRFYKQRQLSHIHIVVINNRMERLRLTALWNPRPRQRTQVPRPLWWECSAGWSLWIHYWWGSASRRGSPSPAWSAALDRPSALSSSCESRQRTAAKWKELDLGCWGNKEHAQNGTIFCFCLIPPIVTACMRARLFVCIKGALCFCDREIYHTINSTIQSIEW